MSIRSTSSATPTRARSLPSSPPRASRPSPRQTQSEPGAASMTACERSGTCWRTGNAASSSSYGVMSRLREDAEPTACNIGSDPICPNAPRTAPRLSNTLHSAPGSLRSPRSPGVSRPASAHLRSPQSRRKPVPSIVGDGTESEAPYMNALAGCSTNACALPNRAYSGSCNLPSVPAPAYTPRQRPQLNASGLVSLGQALDDEHWPARKRSGDSSFSDVGAAAQSRPYVLPVDPPMPTNTHGPLQPDSPSGSSTSHRNHTSSVHSHLVPPDGSVSSRSHSMAGLPRYSMIEFETAIAGERTDFRTPALAFGLEPNMRERLPQYARKSKTEPKTLAATLWRWGFCFPFFWLIGMFILWSPLHIDQTETDPEKQQKIEEMLAIVRKTEVKYARRCAYSLVILCCLISVVVITVVVVGNYPSDYPAYY